MDSPDQNTEADLDLDLLDFLLTLTPAERLERHDQAMALVRALWAAGRRMDGIDDRSAQAAD